MLVKKITQISNFFVYDQEIVHQIFQNLFSNKFSHFKIFARPGVDISYPDIKKPEACRPKVALDTNPARTLKQKQSGSARIKNEPFLFLLYLIYVKTYNVAGTED